MTSTKKRVYNNISLSNLHKKKLYYTTVLNVLVLPMFININFQLPNTHKREEICKRLALDLTFYMEEKKVEPENIFPVFPASFCSKVYYFPVFPEKFLKTGIFPVFQFFQQEWTHCYKRVL